MSHYCGIKVRKSRLTGHWVVNPENPFTAQGFRRWEDAIAEAQERAGRLRAAGRRLRGREAGAS